MANAPSKTKVKPKMTGKKFEKTKDMKYDRYGFDAMEKCAVSDKKCAKKKRK